MTCQGDGYAARIPFRLPILQRTLQNGHTEL